LSTYNIYLKNIDYVQSKYMTKEEDKLLTSVSTQRC
jgi:hypothetical protein